MIYRGPWRSVTDDDGHTLHRGKRMAVCEKTFDIYTREPYARDIVAVPPHTNVPFAEAGIYDCSRQSTRDPRETKGHDYRVTRRSDTPCCGSESDCC